MKIKKHKLIYIEWADAFREIYPIWHTEEEAIEWAEDNKWIVKHVGWIIKETKAYLLLASETTEDQYGLLQKIPKTWIKKRKELKV